MVENAEVRTPASDLDSCISGLILVPPPGDRALQSRLMQVWQETCSCAKTFSLETWPMSLRKWFTVSVLAIAACATPAMAADVRACLVRVEEPIPGQQRLRAVLVNTCDTRIYAFWCQARSGAGDYACGGTKFYRQGRYFGPGERYSNQFTVPMGVTLETGACTGRFTKIRMRADGGYECPADNLSEAGRSHSAEVDCDDARRISFVWSLKGESDKGAAVRLGDGVVFVPRAAFEAFETAGVVPEAVRMRVCRQPSQPPAAGWYRELRSRLKSRAKASESEGAEPSGDPDAGAAGTGERG